MKSGIPRDDEGFDILIDGVQRRFLDLKANACGAARELKRLNRNSILEIVTDRRGKSIMLEDGRMS